MRPPFLSCGAFILLVFCVQPYNDRGMKNFTHFFVRKGLKSFFPAHSEQFHSEASAPYGVVGKTVVPVVLASPHSGRCYSEAFVSNSRQPLSVLRRGEDSYVEELAAEAQACGPTLLHALFPRVFCDANRAAWDMDPRMFDGPVPAFVKPSERAFSGLGSVPRIAAGNCNIYRKAIPFEEAARRIQTCWLPYHHALYQLLGQAHTRFGIVLLLDLHSMPDAPDAGSPDFVLGDCHGRSCAARFTDCAEHELRQAGFRVSRNKPYAGGYITQHYGRPQNGFHALQIEMRRSLYMKEATYEKTENFSELSSALRSLTEVLIKESLSS